MVKLQQVEDFRIVTSLASRGIEYTVRGDQKVLQLEILHWKTFHILYTSKTYISFSILIWATSGCDVIV